MEPNPIVLDRVRGCMVGAVLGDCLGAPVECQHWFGIPKKSVRKHFDAYKEKGTTHVDSLMRYTDDTAMARQVALSLIDRKALDVQDMAKRFVKDYKQEPWRGYGQSVGEVFRKLDNINVRSSEDAFQPAAEQFNGSGSYGNGAAMRAHPIGLFGKSMLEVQELADMQARLTHAHDEGVMGGVLQASAVHLALNQATTKDTLQQLKSVSEKWEMEKSKGSKCSEENEDNPEEEEVNRTYSKQLKSIDRLLGEVYNEETIANAVKILGNDIAAIRSAPTALFCFLKAQDPIDGFCETNPFQRTLELAMSFGGDSDTIMSMAGAIAGAYYGEKNIPQYLIALCEGVKDAQNQAEEIYRLLQPH